MHGITLRSHAARFQSFDLEDSRFRGCAFISRKFELIRDENLVI